MCQRVSNWTNIAIVHGREAQEVLCRLRLLHMLPGNRATLLHIITMFSSKAADVGSGTQVVTQMQCKALRLRKACA